MEIVIIGQNEGAGIEKMLQSLSSISARRMWVLDRCTDNSEALLKVYGERYVKTPGHLTGRQTSFARNLGLSCCDPSTDILFLDGDRYLVKGDLQGLLRWEKDIALLSIENDSRTLETDYQRVYGNVYNGFFSCGIFLKRTAINQITAFQNGELFSTEMQEVWGIEDTYLGDVCYHLGLTCDIYQNCRLNGCFDRNNVDSLDVVEQRFRARENLCVKW